jgi:6-pyruvoyltetrahydropterin/6-carboxytetrahydropterin synthase
MLITRRLEFDAGHRIPDHLSQCRHLHGHRYVLEVTVKGEIINHAGQADNGMVMDFADVKAIAKQFVVDEWDHAFLCWREDHVVRDFLATLPGHKTVILDRVPTAENLALIAGEILRTEFSKRYAGQLFLCTIRLYETPNCWAEMSF